MSKVIEIENISKIYDLGLVGTGTLYKDLNRTWAKIWGKSDPYALITEENDRTIKSETNIVYALKDINFSVNQGEVVGVIGKNGAGKSTLLKILSEITTPSTGQIKMKGRVASLLEVGTGMHPEMTARQNIFLNGTLMGMKRNEIKFKLDEIVDFAGILKYLDTPIKRFSSGMQVRLGFAIAAFLEPEILIVDEVLAVGDAEFQKRAIGKMQEISKGKGRTVLFVSHNMGSIKSLCSRGILIDKGVLSFDGSASDCVDKYLQNNKKEIGIKLSDIKNRNGNGKFRFSDFSLYDSKNQKISKIVSGEYLKIVLNFTCNNQVDFSRLILAINFKDNNENIVVSFVSDEMGVKFKTPKSNVIELEIKKLMLRGGEYIIRLLAMEGDTKKENFLDFIENAFILDVVSSDYWSSGKTLRNHESAIIDGKLKIK